MYNTILLTLDGSEVPQQAIPHAVTLAKQTGASAWSRSSTPRRK